MYPSASVSPVRAPLADVVVKPMTSPLAVSTGESPGTDHACASLVSTRKMAERREQAGGGASRPIKRSDSPLRLSATKGSMPASLQWAKSRSVRTLKPFSTRSAFTAWLPNGLSPSCVAVGWLQMPCFAREGQLEDTHRYPTHLELTHLKEGYVECVGAQVCHELARRGSCEVQYFNLVGNVTYLHFGFVENAIRREVARLLLEPCQVVLGVLPRAHEIEVVFALAPQLRDGELGDEPARGASGVREPTAATQLGQRVRGAVLEEQVGRFRGDGCDAQLRERQVANADAR
eukprot:scaffold300089_cov28-Tisochrysis_lutea.AAC.5